MDIVFYRYMSNWVISNQAGYCIQSHSVNFTTFNIDIYNSSKEIYIYTKNKYETSFDTSIQMKFAY